MNEQPNDAQALACIASFHAYTFIKLGTWAPGICIINLFGPDAKAWPHDATELIVRSALTNLSFQKLFVSELD